MPPLHKTERRRAGRWLTGLAGASLAGASLCGCANFWDDVTSRDFKFESLWTAKPNPMVVLRDSNDGDQRARALLALREPKQHGGSDEEQDAVLKVLTAAAANEHQPLCRQAAITALGRFKDPRAASALKDAYERAGSVATSSGLQQAGFQVPTGFQPETTTVLRCRALESLGANGNPEGLDLLVRVLRQPPVEGTDQERQQNMDERISAARALGNYKQYEATEALLGVLKTEKDVALRDCAADSLRKATGKKLPAEYEAWEELLHNSKSPGGKETPRTKAAVKPPPDAPPAAETPTAPASPKRTGWLW